MVTHLVSVLRPGMGPLAIACALVVAVGAGCRTVPPSNQDQAVAAAREVLAARYPIVSAGESQLFATTGVEAFGTDKSRKQITVYFTRDFTGRAEPRVSVEQLVAVNEPELARSSHDAPAKRAIPFERWKAVARLPLEEQAIYDEIIARVGSGEI